MIRSKSIVAALLPALVMTCAFATVFAEPAAAQTARGLKCNGCVDSRDIKRNGVKSSDIKDGQVKTQDLANNAVTGSKIADGAVGSADLSLNAVTSAKVADGSLKAEDLMDEAGVDYVGGNQNFTLTGIQVVRTVSVTVPRPGTVVVSAHGFYKIPGNSLGSASCMISASANYDLAAEMNVLLSAGAAGASVPFAGTRPFAVDAGTHTFRLVCILSSGTVSVRDSYMTAMYFPTRY